MKKVSEPTAALDKQPASAGNKQARAMKGTGNKTALALAGTSVALTGFGLSRVRFAGCLCVAEGKSSGSERDSNQVAGQ